MKKIVISILATMCVIAIACSVIVKNITAQYEADYTNAITVHEAMVQELYEENCELESRAAELENGIYNMMNGEDYDVTVEHDDARYNYVCEKDGWFKNIKIVETRSLDN